MNKSFFEKVKVYFHNFKLRFSYFLFAGLLGTILEIIAYFALASNTTKINLIVLEKKSTAFSQYILPSYLLVFSAILLGIMAFGFYKCAKKQDSFVKIGAIDLMASEAATFIVSIFSIVYLYINRTKLLNNNINTGIYVISSIKLIILVFKSIGYSFISMGLINAKKQDGLGKIGIFTNLFSSVLFIIASFFTVILSSSKDYSSTYFKYYANTNVNIKYNTINGFSLGQFKGLSETVSIADSLSDTTNKAIATFGVFYQITYMVLLFGFLVLIVTSLIQSYDIEKDNDRMSL